MSVIFFIKKSLKVTTFSNRNCELAKLITYLVFSHIHIYDYLLDLDYCVLRSNSVFWPLQTFIFRDIPYLSVHIKLVQNDYSTIKNLKVHTYDL